MCNGNQQLQRRRVQNNGNAGINAPRQLNAVRQLNPQQMDMQRAGMRQQVQQNRGALEGEDLQDRLDISFNRFLSDFEIVESQQKQKQKEYEGFVLVDQARDFSWYLQQIPMKNEDRPQLPVMTKKETRDILEELKETRKKWNRDGMYMQLIDPLEYEKYDNPEQNVFRKNLLAHMDKDSDGHLSKKENEIIQLLRKHQETDLTAIDAYLDKKAYDKQLSYLIEARKKLNKLDLNRYPAMKQYKVMLDILCDGKSQRESERAKRDFEIKKRDHPESVIDATKYRFVKTLNWAKNAKYRKLSSFKAEELRKFRRHPELYGFTDEGYVVERPEETKITMESNKDVPLFSRKPSLKDISQGKLGDCYMLTGLASLVSQRPDFIPRMMTDNNDGTVTVRGFFPLIMTKKGERLYTTRPWRSAAVFMMGISMRHGFPK